MPTTLDNIAQGLDRWLDCCAGPDADTLMTVSLPVVRYHSRTMMELVDADETIFLSVTGAHVDQQDKRWPGLLCISGSHVTFSGRRGTLRNHEMTARFPSAAITYLDDDLVSRRGNRRSVRFQTGQGTDVFRFELPTELMPPEGLAWLSGALLGAISFETHPAASANLEPEAAAASGEDRQLGEQS